MIRHMFSMAVVLSLLSAVHVSAADDVLVTVKTNKGNMISIPRVPATSDAAFTVGKKKILLRDIDAIAFKYPPERTMNRNGDMFIVGYAMFTLVDGTHMRGNFRLQADLTRLGASSSQGAQASTKSKPM